MFPNAEILATAERNITCALTNIPVTESHAVSYSNSTYPGELAIYARDGLLHRFGKFADIYDCDIARMRSRI